MPAALSTSRSSASQSGACVRISEEAEPSPFPPPRDCLLAFASVNHYGLLVFDSNLEETVPVVVGHNIHERCRLFPFRRPPWPRASLLFARAA